MPAPDSSAEAVQPSDSIVDRATAVLAAQSALPTRSATPLGAGVEQLSNDPFAELDKRLGAFRHQLLDVVDVLARFGERLPATAIEPGRALPATPSARVTPFDAALPQLRTAHAVAGSIGKSVLGLVNETNAPVSVLLRATSLVSESGDEIPGNLVTFAPNPLQLPAGAELPVQANVAVPSGARPGRYAGLVQGAGLEAARAVLSIDVQPLLGGT